MHWSNFVKLYYRDFMGIASMVRYTYSIYRQEHIQTGTHIHTKIQADTHTDSHPCKEDDGYWRNYFAKYSI